MTTATIIEQLQHLKALTVRTGAIHEAQALQVRNYPMLVDGITNSETKIDVERKMVIYKIKCKRKLKEKELVKFKKIEEYIRFVLWPDTLLVVKRGAVVLFDSRA
jgi:hypothetical protein